MAQIEQSDTIAGVVVEIKRRKGEWVEPGETVIRILRIDSLRAEGFVDASQVRGVALDEYVGIPEELAEEQEYDPIDQLERELVEAQILTQDDAVVDSGWTGTEPATDADLRDLEDRLGTLDPGKLAFGLRAAAIAARARDGSVCAGSGAWSSITSGTTPESPSVLVSASLVTAFATKVSGQNRTPASPTSAAATTMSGKGTLKK